MSLEDFYTQPFPTIHLDETYILREHTMQDAVDFLNYFSRPNAHKFNIASQAPQTIEESTAEIKYCHDLFYQKKGIYWSIAKISNQQMIGAIGIHTRAPRCHGEIHYDLDEDYWNKGIMTRALQKTLHHCFFEKKLESIEARTLKGNVASIKVLEKLNFHYTRTIANYPSFNGKTYDIEVYELNS